MDRYFAYGSNMSLRRLRARIPSAGALGAARLAGMAWRCNKQGSDGTAKANLVLDANAWVWGVLFRIDPIHWPELDRFEGGYARRRVEVALRDGKLTSATTYVSQRIAPELRPSRSYVEWMVEGAREHRLPADWIAMLEAHSPES